MNSLLKSMYRGSPLLCRTAFFHMVLALVAFVIMEFDQRVLWGVDPFLKPFKFMISIGMYLYTLAWLLDKLERRLNDDRLIAKLAAFTMLGETFILWTQASRGVMSHFINTSPLNIVLNISMWILGHTNAFAAAWLAVIFFKRKTKLSEICLWGARFGLITFVVGSLLGNAPLLNSGHTVGAPQDGPGLPLLNWSTIAGDLRIAHVLGIHGIQLFPLVAWGIEKYKLPSVCLHVAFWGWAALILFTLIQAIAGQPFIALN